VNAVNTLLHQFQSSLAPASQLPLDNLVGKKDALLKQFADE